MRKSEAVQLRLVSSCHDVQSDSKHKDFESAPNFVAGKASSSSIHEVSQVRTTFDRHKIVVWNNFFSGKKSFLGNASHVFRHVYNTWCQRSSKSLNPCHIKTHATLIELIEQSYWNFRRIWAIIGENHLHQTTH